MRNFTIAAFVCLVLAGAMSYGSRENFLRPAGEAVRELLASGEPDTGPLARLAVLRDRLGRLVDSRTNSRTRFLYVTLHGMIKTLLGTSVVTDVDPRYDVVRLKNGFLDFLPRFDDPPDGETARANMRRMHEYVRGAGGNLLYVQVPRKYSKYGDMLPDGLSNPLNDRLDRFGEFLAGEGIPYLDLRAEFHDLGIDQYDLFFRTDHHWKPEGAFLANGLVARRMRDLFSLDIDEGMLELRNYRREVHEDLFLGSQGKRVGPVFAGGAEDFTLLYPRGDTDFEVSVPSHGILRRGGFGDAMFDTGNLRRDLFGSNTYATCLGGDFPIQRLKNLRKPEGKKVLMFKDSFACAFAPFLALQCGELVLVDMRLQRASTAYELLDRERPDIVLVMLGNWGAPTMDFDLRMRNGEDG